LRPAAGTAGAQGGRAPVAVRSDEREGDREGDQASGEADAGPREEPGVREGRAGSRPARGAQGTIFRIGWGRQCGSDRGWKGGIGQARKRVVRPQLTTL